MVPFSKEMWLWIKKWEKKYKRGKRKTMRDFSNKNKKSQFAAHAMEHAEERSTNSPMWMLKASWV